jgi:hypothetical protein
MAPGIETAIAGLAVPVVKLVGHELQPSDLERIRGSFVAALEQQLAPARERHLLESMTGQLAIAARRLATNTVRRATVLGSQAVQAENLARKQREAAAAGVAADLVDGLRAAGVASALEPGEAGEGWREALRGFLRGAAIVALSEGEEERRRAWSYVVSGGAAALPRKRKALEADEDLVRWADAVAGRVEFSWLFDDRYSGLIDQMNVEDDRALAQALVLATREVAEGLRLLRLVGIPMLLLGGGAVALLVLLIDKG